MKNKASLGMGLALFLLSNSVSAQAIDRVFYGNNPQNFGQLIKNAFNLSHFNKSYAVVVGISRYQGFSSLPSTSNDAIRMKDFLINKAGFDYVHLITEERATLPRLRQVMLDVMPDKVKGNDRFVFYWSGHGETRVLNSKPHGYLPLSNSGPEQYSNMLRMRTLAEWDEGLSAKQTLYLLDACFSGLAGFQKKGRRNQTIEQIARPSRQILTAGLANEETIASSSFGGSLFTTAIIDGLEGEADTSFGRYRKDGIVSTKELELYVKQRVNEEIRTRRLGRRLTPSLHSFEGSGAGDFFFVDKSHVEKKVNLPQMVVSKAIVNTKSATPAASKSPISHYHAANQYSRSLEHSHPGGSVPHPHNYGNRIKPSRQQVVKAISKPIKKKNSTNLDMVNIPSGELAIDCSQNTIRAIRFCVSKSQVRKISLEAFAISKTEVTFDQWDLCVKDRACSHVNDLGLGRSGLPVFNVSYTDAQKFVRWLNGKTRGGYSLPNLQQWIYAAKGVKPTTKDSIPCTLENFNAGRCSANVVKPVLSGSINPYGLYGFGSNVGEWVIDCLDEVRISKDDCSGVNKTLSSVAGAPYFLDGKSHSRTASSLSSNRLKHVGFRVVRLNAIN